MAVDPSTVLGSWDEVLFVPTNSTVGALTTGVGDAHSHPHKDNLLTDGWLQSYYGGEPWGVAFNGTSTTINCNSGATLDDLCAGGAIMQVEGWVKITSAGVQQCIISKGRYVVSGWYVWMFTDNIVYFTVILANTSIVCNVGLNGSDGKWHHFVAHYNDTTKVAQGAWDGIWGAASGVGDGAYVSDVALNLRMGSFDAGTPYYLTGALGWINIYNNAFYTPGTNFKPSRTPTAPDVEEWLINEGTGATATAQVTTPANDGTITNGTWQPQWYAEGTPIVPTSVQGSATYRAVITAAATINDLQDNAFTIEGWFRVPKVGALENLLCRKRVSGSNNGWSFQISNTGLLLAFVSCATTSAISTTTARVDDGRWHYLKFTYDDAGDRKPYITVDNVAVAQTQVAGNGAIGSDAAVNGLIGNNEALTNGLLGAHGWIRWSNVVRGAGMISRSTPPDPTDANTMLQFNADEGALAVLTDMSGEGNNGAMAGTYSWINTGAMDLDSPGARVYGWGDARGSNAVSEGEKITYTGLTAGANYVLRALAYSEDGVGIPRVEVYDETNAAAITAITGLATSTEWTPDVLIFSFELPTNARGAAADCTSFSIERISTTAGNVGWHQIELYANLLDNPSLDTGAVANPWIPYGWTNSALDAGDTEIEVVTRHSEGASMQLNPGAVWGENIYQNINFGAIGNFAAFGFHAYCDGVSVIRVLEKNGYYFTRHSNPSINTFSSPTTAAWTHTKEVVRTTVAACQPGYNRIVGGAGEIFLDDIYMFLLDNVTLTVTPASAANSLEGTGIRADGYDLLSTPTAGEMAYNWWYAEVFITPRHSDATVGLFGIAMPCWIEFRYNAANTLLLDWSAANTLRLRVVTGGVTYTGTWATGGGAVLAGTKYLIKIEQYYGEYRVFVGGIQRITIPGVPAFPFVPNIAYWGMDNARAYNSDIVVSSY